SVRRSGQAHAGRLAAGPDARPGPAGAGRTRRGRHRRPAAARPGGDEDGADRQRTRRRRAGRTARQGGGAGQHRPGPRGARVAPPRVATPRDRRLNAMPVDMAALAADLAAESAVTRALVAGLDEAGWHTPTPAAGWDIADQISHLAYFDEVTVQSAVDPEQFKAELADAEASGGINPDTIAVRFRDRSGAQLLDWFGTARTELLNTFKNLDPRTRLPWFGPPMSAASSLTARIMETWAH